jgi:hypothetical protein
VEQRSNGPCYQFRQQGYCRWQPHCKFTHDGPPAGGPPGGPGGYGGDRGYGGGYGGGTGSSGGGAKKGKRPRKNDKMTSSHKNR